MNESFKPRLVISRCIGFEACRYNGQMLRDGLVELLKGHAEIITLCPEADIGLGTPRKPVRLVQQDGELRMLQPATGVDVSEAMQAYIGTQINELHDIDGFILKGRSPSCGLSGVKVYQSTEPGAMTSRGDGMFAAAVKQHFPLAAMEDEGRLTNFHLREAFLMRLFSLARLRELMSTPSVAALTRFHASHKLLLMCFNQEQMRRCGRIASNGDGLELHALMETYAQAFREALLRDPRQSNVINALYHGYGWVSDGLAPGEKKLFLETIEEYRDDRVTLSTLQHLLKSYVVRFDHEYLGGQYFLDPYPQPLFNLSDSGK